MTQRLLLALSFCLPGLALAGDETPAAVLGRLLSAARDSGALTRAIEERTFVFGEGDGKALIVSRGEKLADGSGVWFEMQFEMLGRSQVLRERCELPFAGGTRRVEIEVTEGPGRGGKGGGEVKDGKCELKLEQAGGGETTTQSLEWGEDVVPMSAALFLLPGLIDEGLPAELKLRMFEGEDMRVNKFLSVLTLAAEPTTDGETKVREVAIARREGQTGDMFKARVKVEGDEKGRIHSITVDGRTMTPITREEADKLRKEAAANEPKDELAPPDAPPPPK